MFKTYVCTLLFCLNLIIPVTAQPFTTDSIKTNAGILKITFIGHASLLFNFAGKNIYVDPYSKLTDYSQLPQADLILITHEHPDHLDLKAVAAIRTKKTQLIITKTCAAAIPDGIVMNNGDTQALQGLTIEAVPAYNLVHKRPDGKLFHPQGSGNGYVVVFGDTRIYVAGDTENIPEMKNLRNIYCAFLPMNLPYTMTPKMVVAAVELFHPKILYPYHYGITDPQDLLTLLQGRPDIEVRIRSLR